MIHFFHTNSWNVSLLSKKWVQIVKASAPTYVEDDMYVIIGDGVKQSKEARKMPGVKRLHQESENSSKSEYIFGSLGILIGNANKMFCAPVSATIQDGVKQIREWDNQTVEFSHVTQMIKNVFDVTKELGLSILLLDRYFLTIPALKKLSELNIIELKK